MREVPHVFLTYGADENPGRLSDAEKRQLVREFENWLGLSAASRLIMRDRAVRAALDLYADLRPYPGARKLEADLSRYLTGGYRREVELVELPEPASEMRRSWHTILRLNRDRGLSWSQILRILDGHHG
jgi:hypothetical protein